METIKPKEVNDSGQGESSGQKTGLSVDHAQKSEAQQHLARIAVAQGAPVVRNVTDLAVEFWPDDESADDINRYIYRQRRQDRNKT